MGRAQKLKQQRKQEKMANEKRLSDQRKVTLTTIVTIILVIAGGFWLNNWYQKNKIADESASQVVMHTSQGDIKLALFKEKAPKTVENFLGLVKNGYYNGTKFHRVIADFMIQGGDPLSRDEDPNNDGTGGEDFWGGKFADEINPWSLGLDEETISLLQESGYVYRDDLSSEKMRPGVIAMANSGPNTNGSQFFIVTTKDQPHLDGRHTVFGEVVEGMDVVMAIQNLEVGDNDRPITDVIVESIDILSDVSDMQESDQSLPFTVETVEGDNSSAVQLEEISFE